GSEGESIAFILFRHFRVAVLERDIVILEIVRRRRRGRLARGLLRRARGRTFGMLAAIAAVATTTATTFSTASGASEHLHFIGDDVGRVALDAFLVGVFVGT